jgi:hypothetical protein
MFICSVGRKFTYSTFQVLAFEEVSSSKHLNHPSYQPPPAHSRCRSQPLSAHREANYASPIAMTTQAKRARAPSDPFLDMPALSHSLPSASSQSSGATIPSSDIPETCPTSVIPHDQDAEDELLPPLRSEFIAEDPEDYLRTWTSPDLGNPELLSLLTVFPSFITRRALPRFLVSPNAADIEEGEGGRGEGKEIHFGTGSMWISSKPRGDGWRGDLWTRFVLWWRRLFC